MKSDRAWLLGLMLPCAAVFLVFFVIPLTRLLLIGGSGELGWAAYSAAFTEPRYLRSMLSTVALSALVTLTTLVISAIAGVFLARQEFAGRQVLVEEQEPGVWLVRTATVVPDNERWLHEGQAASDLQQAMAWSASHTAQDDDTTAQLDRLAKGEGRNRVVSG